MATNKKSGKDHECLVKMKVKAEQVELKEALGDFILFTHHQLSFLFL